MTCSRWVRVCVDMLDHPVVGASIPPPKPADPSRHAMQPALAWLDLISAAAWKAHEVRHKDKLMTLQRGEFLAGRSYWAKRWNWGEQSVRSFFSRLSKFEMIAISNQSAGHASNIVAICNYDIYQGSKPEPQPEKKPEPNQSLTSGQPEPNQTVNRDTRDNNNIPSSATTVEQEAAREPAADAKPKIDFHELHEKLVTAANGSLNRTTAALEVLSEPMGWIESGADLDLDIIPAISAIGHRSPPQSINSWSYFRDAVSKAKAKRERGLADVAPDQLHDRNAPAWKVEKDRQMAEFKQALSKYQ